MEEGEEAKVCDLAVRVFDEFVSPHFPREGAQSFSNYADPDLFRWRSRWRHFVLLATIQKKIVGMIEVRDDGHVTMLFVDGRFQRMGIGEELLRRAVSICLGQKPDISKVSVNSSPNAVRIYERIGFRKEGAEKVQNGIRFTPMVLEIERD